MKKYRLHLNPNIVNGLQDKSMLAAAKESHIGYPTFSNMAHGRWNIRALDVLARYLMVCGIPADILQLYRFSDIFLIEEVKEVKDENAQ